MTLNPSCDVLHCGINLVLSHAQAQQRIPSFLFLLYFRFDVYVGVVAAPLVQSAETTGGRDSNTHFSRLVIVRRTHQTPDTNTHTNAPFDSITFEHFCFLSAVLFQFGFCGNPSGNEIDSTRYFTTIF